MCWKNRESIPSAVTHSACAAFLRCLMLCKCADQFCSPTIVLWQTWQWPPPNSRALTMSLCFPPSMWACTEQCHIHVNCLISGLCWQIGPLWRPSNSYSLGVAHIWQEEVGSEGNDRYEMKFIKCRSSRMHQYMHNHVL